MNSLRAQGLIKDWGTEVLEVRAIPGGWTLIRLNMSDMRQIAFKLTHGGLFNLKGINPVDRSRVNPGGKKTNSVKGGKKR